MKKVFEFRGWERRVIQFSDNIQHLLIKFSSQKRCSTGSSNKIDARKTLFRQPQSCPHFSNRIQSSSYESTSSEHYYYLRMRPDVLDIDGLLQRVGQFVGKEFIYLNYAVPVESEFFTPYSFKEVPYACIDRQQYFTISGQGFAMWSRAECLFTPLQDWMDEYRKYSLISRVRWFR